MFLDACGLRWDWVTLEQVGEFTAWLRRPADNVIVLATGTPQREARTVNRMVSALFGFYGFHPATASRSPAPWSARRADFRFVNIARWYR